jgi:maltose O-acetyltransferase
MNRSEIHNKLLFDYRSLSLSEIQEIASVMTNKELRWLGANHMDNRTRKVFYRLSNIEIGKDTVINQNFIVSDDYEQLLKVGDRVAISPNVTIVCSSGPNNSDLNKNSYVKDNLIVSKKVIIGDDSWIGTGVIIMPGVEIGSKCVVGAGAVVTKSVKSNSVIIGNPAKVIREI